MNARAMVTVSMVVNVALLVLALKTGHTPAIGESGAASMTGAKAEVTRVKTNLSRVEVTVTNEAAAFHWSAVQSEDLKEYAENLRSIGCPSETVREIIEGEVDEWFLSRRRVLLEPLQRGYWDLAAKGGDLSEVIEPFEKQVDRLKEERTERLAVILGKSPEPSPGQERKERLDYVTEQTQEALASIQKEHSKALKELRPTDGGAWTPELRAKRKALDERQKASIRALLSPEEFAEYEIRTSRYARRAYVAGFEPTPGEARAVAQLYSHHEAADVRLANNDPDAAAKKKEAATAKLEREEALKQTLGAERYAQFQQGMDGNFGAMYAITKRYDLPRETAAQAAEVLNARKDALKQLRADKAMSQERRGERELAVHLETRSELLRAVGERALGTYEKHQGPIVPRPKELAPE